MKAAICLAFLCSCVPAGFVITRVAVGTVSGIGYGFRASREIKGAFAEMEREEEYRRQVAHHRAWIEGREGVNQN